MNTEYRLEQFLTALRRRLLLERPRNAIPLGLTVALACQCYIGEYVFAESQAERDACTALGAEIARAGADWSILSGLLKPGGVFHVGLYSEGARRVIVEARNKIAKHGTDSTLPGIREFRQGVLDAGEDGPFARLLGTYDLFITSSCRDLIFHVQEHRFTWRK